jgi:hypothetical protein
MAFMILHDKEESRDIAQDVFARLPDSDPTENKDI